jgi:K+-transporting ATPase KdpF subunit
MAWIHGLSAVLAIGLLVYLIFALIDAEKL